MGYTVHLVKRDDQYITDLLAYLKQFWDSAHNRNCPIPPWQKDALDLKIRAKEIRNNCAKLSSGNSVREKRLLDKKSINQFWDIQKDHKRTKAVAPRKCGACRRQLEITTTSGEGMLILEECFKLRENGSFLDSKLRLWKWLRDQTDSGQTYYALERAASIIGILFRLTEKSNESFTSNFRISEKYCYVCTTKPQQHKSNRVKNHTIFPISDTDILQEHVLDDSVNLVR